jgi:hypothetical protein
MCDVNGDTLTFKAYDNDNDEDEGTKWRFPDETAMA